MTSTATTSARRPEVSTGHVFVIPVVREIPPRAIRSSGTW
jgi:hypothetical protein